MNPFDCRIVLRARTPLEVADLTVVLLRVWARPLARVAAVALLPWMTLAVLATWRGAGVAVMGTIVLLAPLLQAPFSLLGARLLFGEAPDRLDLGRAVGAAWLRLLVLVGAQVTLLGVSACTGMLLWLPTHAAVLLLPETLLLEGTPVWRSVSRSGLLAREHLGRAAGGAAAVILVGAWAVVAAEGLGQVVVGQLLELGQPFGALLTGDVTPYAVVGLLAAQPVIALFRLLLYVDLRTALDGWDLQVALRAAAEEA